MAIRIGDTSFLVFHFWDLKLVPIDSALILYQVILRKILKNVGMVPRKPAKFETPGYNFSEMSFVIYSRKTGKYFNQIFLQEVDQESCG